MGVSAVDRESGLLVIKPSGVEYDRLTAKDMVVVDLATDETIEGKYKPIMGKNKHQIQYIYFT